MAMLPLAAVSCVEEDFEAGEPDLENCCGVYFPSQRTSFLLDDKGDESWTLTFTVKRLKDEGPATVPLRDIFEPSATLEEYESYTRNDRIIIDASNPSAVIFPEQELGVNFESGWISAASCVSGILDIDEEDSIYGTYDKASGVIEFPEESIAISESGYMDGEWVESNDKILTRLVLPGFSVYDWSVVLDAGLSEDGQLPVHYTLGSDVTRAKYAVYGGVLSESEAQEKAAGIAAGTETGVKEIYPGMDGASEDEDGYYLEISGLETGVYTLVSANYGAVAGEGGAASAADEYKGFSYVTFHYVAAGDEVPVILDVELNVTDKYQSFGHTSENSLEVYIAGKDIEEAYMILTRDDCTVYDPVMLEKLLQSLISLGGIEPVSDKRLAEINSIGFLDIADELLSGTLYSLMVYASNGYEWSLKIVTATTAGEYDIMEDTFTRNDFYPIESATELYGTYDCYAVDGLGNTGKRERTGTVTIGEGSDGKMSVMGLLGPAASECGVEDVLPFIFEGGKNCISSCCADFDEEYEIAEGVSLTLAAGFFSSGRPYPYLSDKESDRLMSCGRIDEEGNVLALVDSGTDRKYNFNGIGLVAYEKGHNYCLKTFSSYSEVLLVRQGTSVRRIRPAGREKLSETNHLRMTDFTDVFRGSGQY